LANSSSVRIIRLANFVMPRSGGLRTALQALGEGYLAAGHEPVLIVPGAHEDDSQTSQGRVITVRGTVVPGTGGYRVLLGRRRLTALLDELAPDRLEVSDRFTLRWTAGWARERGVPSTMVSHESLAGLFGVAGVGGRAGRWLTDQFNRRTLRAYDRVVCTTGWASAELARLAVGNVVQVPLGVDLDLFHPDRRDPRRRVLLANDEQTLIVHCGRLSPEKSPGRSVQALRQLRRSGVDAVLAVAGDGPLRGRLERLSADLPVRFVDFVSERERLASLLASADVVIAPGPIETFGLAALEALASGTPVVVDGGSALPEVVGDAGVAVRGEGHAFAAGVCELLARPESSRRAAARARAEQFGWDAAVDGFLAVHGLTRVRTLVESRR
jgi:alpha-1,6-mannosyltransferase